MKTLSKALLLLLLLTSCQSKRLYVIKKVLDREFLASSYVKTPDRHKDNPKTGIRLVVYWNLPEELFLTTLPEIRLTVLKRSHKVDQVTFSLKKKGGHFFYDLVNEAYETSGGILTYKAEVLAEKKILEIWEHQMWVEPINLNANPWLNEPLEGATQVQEHPDKDQTAQIDNQ